MQLHQTGRREAGTARVSASPGMSTVGQSLHLACGLDPAVHTTHGSGRCCRCYSTTSSGTFISVSQRRIAGSAPSACHATSRCATVW